MQTKVDLIIPSIPSDIDIFINNIDSLFSKLPIKKLIIVGPEEIEKLIPFDSRIKVLCEDYIVDKHQIKKIFSSRTRGDNCNARMGWYLQQFIKMAYSRICEDMYYLIWDSDTVPLKNVILFDKKDCPVFHVKTEYHKPYFEVINKLIPGLHKQIEGSFIAEHMLVKTEYMLSLISTIESNKNIEGNSFEEKILRAIDIKDLCDCGFSEFETYGTFVQYKYPLTYTISIWNSLRFGGFFFPYSNLRERDIDWLSKKYDAISFEKNHHLNYFSNVARSNLFQSFFSPRLLDFISLIPRVINRITH